MMKIDVTVTSAFVISRYFFNKFTSYKTQDIQTILMQNSSSSSRVYWALKTVQFHDQASVQRYIVTTYFQTVRYPFFMASSQRTFGLPTGLCSGPARSSRFWFIHTRAPHRSISLLTIFYVSGTSVTQPGKLWVIQSPTLYLFFAIGKVKILRLVKANRYIIMLIIAS